MNERIRGLAELAGLLARTMGPTVETRYMKKKEQDLEKFAELIVRQCGYYADVFEALGCPVDMDPTDTKPSDYILKKIWS